MPLRTPQVQSAHDAVIRAVAAAQTRHDAYTNPNQQHNWSVQVGGIEVYPDLILCEPGTRTVAHLIEVETEDSVTEAEAEQWATYARGPGRFWLLVPASSAAARSICRRKGIAAQVGQWWWDGTAIRFDWLLAAA